jgi:hypothetical protein
MFSVRILTTSAALLLVTGLAQTPAYACDNLFFPCPPPGSPGYPRSINTGVPVTTSPPVIWGMQPVPATRVVAQPSKRSVTKSTKRRVAKYRARQKPAVKAVAAVVKPAATTATKPAAPAVTPAAEPAVAAARSIIFAAASLDEVTRSVKREPDKDPKEPAAKLVAVVDANEVNEIDLAAAPARTVVPVFAAAVEESKERASAPPVNASVGQVLAIVLGAVAAACVFRFASVAKNA